MELDLKWRRKRSGRRLRPPFIAAPPANREGCWAVTWRGVRRAPCREELEASEGRSGAGCRGARGRQWERLREAKVAGAEGNNGGGTCESRGGTSIAGPWVRSEVALGGRAEMTGDPDEQGRRADDPEQRRRGATVPLASRAFCVARPVRLTPFLRLRPPVRSCGGCCHRPAAPVKGRRAPSRLAQAATRQPAGRTRVSSSRRLEPAEQKADARRPLRPGGGGSAAGSLRPGSARPPGQAEAVAEGGAFPVTEDVRKRTRWAGKGPVREKAGSLTSPARHARGSVRTCPGPLAPAPPGCAGLAPALRVPSSGVRLFVPAHARPILTDRVRGSPAANRRARLAFPAPSESGAPPLGLPTWSGPGPLSCTARQLFGRCTLGGFLCNCGFLKPACLPRLWPLAVASAVVVTGP